LRARITIAFAVGALFLSALLAASTWGFTRQNQLDQRSSSATTLAVANAENMTEGITAATPSLRDLVQAQPRPTGAHPILLYDGDWYPADAAYGQHALPEELIRVVEEGNDARMRYTYNDEVYLAVGVKLDTEVDAAYFEVVSLEELEQTLETLGVSLIAAALVTTLAGALLGWWAARRVLRPLNRVGAAAEDIQHARDWTHDPARQTDYCPSHAASSTAPAAGVAPPRPTTAARDEAGNPLDRDEYAQRLRTRLAAGEEATVAARLLEELAGIYRGETIGTLAYDVAALLDRPGRQP
jgi:hypothetical protein